jgi:hypothetical protein
MVRIAADHGLGPRPRHRRIVAYEQSCRSLGERDRRSLAAGGWHLFTVAARRLPVDVLAEARRALGL